MGWVLRLVETGVDGSSRSVDVMAIDRPGDLGDIAALGLTLAQGKRLVALVQQEIFAAQSRDHLTVQAVVAHYNRLSVTLSDHADQYRPMFKPHREGGVDTLYWWLGFTAGIELDCRSWKGGDGFPAAGPHPV